MTRPPAECSPSTISNLKCPRRAQETWYRRIPDPSSTQALLGTAVHEIAAAYAALCARKGQGRLSWFSFEPCADAALKRFYKRHPEVKGDGWFTSEVWQMASDLHRNFSLPVSSKGERWRHIAEERIVVQWPERRTLSLDEASALDNGQGRIDWGKLEYDVLSGKPDLLSLKALDVDENKRPIWTKGYLMDVKTGRQVVMFKQAKMNFQLRYYAWLAFMAYPTLETVDVVVFGFWLKDNKGAYTYKRDTECKFDTGERGTLTLEDGTELSVPVWETCGLMTWGERTAQQFFDRVDAWWLLKGEGDWPEIPGGCGFCPVSAALACRTLTADLEQLGILEVLRGQ